MIKIAFERWYSLRAAVMHTWGCCAAGLPIGMNTFWRFPTVTGDWLAFIGDDTWLVGDENDGVADLELLNDTV